MREKATYTARYKDKPVIHLAFLQMSTKFKGIFDILRYLSAVKG